ncbi:MAG: hypothetical protein MUO40_11385 [Anaerolineaceae bacterium]|nr:hypothetical protein [Anaerolineaceae bacterium]
MKNHLKPRDFLFIFIGILFTIISTILGYYLISLIKSSTAVTFLSILIIVISPLAGGFLTGLLVKNRREVAGLISGIGSSIIISIAAILLLGFTNQYLLIEIFLIVSWAFLSRLGATLAKSGNKRLG